MLGARWGGGEGRGSRGIHRSGKTFECGYCGWEGDADFNGANNIKRLGGVV
ncbi:zinc ribbon domain-containing protein, partial [Lyngbya sp. CCY1209]|uniref:zinc ribbon domain-containing protein n=1 Tax=Lyngbya sp. CCY1209 TaxID=2886103 RepID=UPI002D7662CA